MLGTLTRSTVAPAFSSASAACSTAASTSGWMPSASVSSSTIPMRSPSTPRSTHGQQRLAPGRGSTWSPRVVAGDHVEEQRGVGHDVGERPDLVERAGERDQAVARHQAVRRLHPHDAAQRGGLPDRAAGVGAERRAARSPRATAAADPPLEPPGTRDGSRGLRVGPNAEFSVDEPIANSSRLVFADRHRAGRDAPARRRSRCTAGASPRGSATSTWWARRACTGCPSATIGTPASGPGSSPRADRGVDRVGRRRARRRPVTRLHACSSASRASITARCSSTTSRGRALTDADRRRELERAHAVTARRGCAGRGTGRPPRPAPSRAPRRGPGSAGRSSGRSTLTSGSGCAVGGTSLGVERRRPPPACSRITSSCTVKLLDLVVGEREPGQTARRARRRHG